jgi:uncharacterized pyridoxal phosphate-containing UPF0001 family protein
VRAIARHFSFDASLSSGTLVSKIEKIPSTNYQIANNIQIRNSNDSNKLGNWVIVV